MTLPFTKDDLKELSVDERIDLIGLIWDSLESQQSEVDLTNAQRTELDRRLDDLEKYPDDVVSADESIANALRKAKA